MATKEELEKNYAAGILDPNDPELSSKIRLIEHFEREGRRILCRVLRKSWWPEELASEEEKENAKKNLSEVGNKVDFVFTHEGPSSTVAIGWGGYFKPNPQSRFLEDIRATLDYHAWLFGHYHENRKLTEKEIVLYEQITRIW